MSETASYKVHAHAFSPPYTALSAAAKIPPELFDDIISFVGCDLPYNTSFLTWAVEEAKQEYHEDVQVLRACALTCVRWANLTRQRLFRTLILRSSDDLRMLKRFLRSPPSPRISSIGAHLESLTVHFTLDRYPWFYDIPSLRSHGAMGLRGVSLHIYGPMASSSPKNTIIRHPLFHGAPRALPISFPPEVTLNVLWMHPVLLPNRLTALNLLRDLEGLKTVARERRYERVTWDISGTRNPRPDPRTICCSNGKNGKGAVIRVNGCTDCHSIVSHLLGPTHTLPQSRAPATCLSMADTLRIKEIIFPADSGDLEHNKWNLEIVRGTCADDSNDVAIPDDLLSKYTYYLQVLGGSFIKDGPQIGWLAYLSDSDATKDIARVKCVLIKFINANPDDEPNLPINIWASDPSNPHWNVWKKIIGLIYRFPTLECLAVMAHDEEQLARYVAWFAEELAPFRDNERVGFAWYCYDIYSDDGPYKVEIGYEDLLKRAKEIEELEDGGSSDESGSEMSDESEDSVENGDFNIESTSQSKSKGTPEMNMFGDDPNSTNTSDYHRATQLQVDYSISAPRDNDPRCNTCGDRLIAVRREERNWAISCPTCSGY